MKHLTQKSGQRVGFWLKRVIFLMLEKFAVYSVTFRSVHKICYIKSIL